MFFNIKIKDDEPIYLQIYKALVDMIQSGMLVPNSKLPSSRELSDLLKVARTTAINAYQLLEDNNFVYTIKGKGTFVAESNVNPKKQWNIDWQQRFSGKAIKSEKLDLMKHEVLYKKGMISFKSIAPDESLFDVEDVKRAFANLMSIEGNKILNYGYARGYKPLIEYLMNYMNKKGVSIEGKSVLITNGFTEGFDLVLSTITEEGDSIICENPTHNTAIKQMRLHDLNILGVNNTEYGIDLDMLKEKLKSGKAKAVYIVPSYHNPTGTVMSYEKRRKVYDLISQYDVPIIEDGFNEELQHLGDHISPIAAVNGGGNSVVYIGSLSKILFPGMRIGWIFGDTRLIEVMESVKRSKNIHTSFLDQGIFYQYMISGSFEKYMKKIRSIYKDKYDFTKELVGRYIPNEYILGDGGLYMYIKLKNIDARLLLKRCCTRGVIFTPGDIFSTNNEEKESIRLGFSRLDKKDIQIGVKIIGEEILNLQ